MSRARDGARVGGSKPGTMREEQGTRPARLDGAETRRREEVGGGGGGRRVSQRPLVLNVGEW